MAVVAPSIIAISSIKLKTTMKDAILNERKNDSSRSSDSISTHKSDDNDKKQKNKQQKKE